MHLGMNFSGTIGQKTPVETSPARHWVLASQKASLRDVSPNKMLRFCTAILLVRHSFKIDWIRRPLAGTVQQIPGGGGGGGWGRERQKISNNVFQTLQIQHLHIELKNESQVALMGRNGDENTGQSCHQWFVISLELERLSFTKMRKMANCGESCQQFTVKVGVARLHVSQLAGKETKGLPMVT